MSQINLSQAKQAVEQQRKKKTWQRSILCVAILVMACITYTLTKPASTLEASCGYTDHSHSTSCYQQTEYLVCGKENEEGHAHGEDCYQLLSCDQESHTHDASCYDQETEQSAAPDPDGGEELSSVDEPSAVDLDLEETSESGEACEALRVTSLTFNITNSGKFRATYDPSTETYSASLNLNFEEQVSDLDPSQIHTIQLPDTISLTDEMLTAGKTWTGKDGDVDAFTYWFVKVTNDEGEVSYAIKMQYLESYVTKLQQSGSTGTVKGQIDFSCRVGKDAMDDEGNLNIKYSDGTTTTIPWNEITYPSDSTANYDVSTEKKFLGLDAENNTITYSVTVSSKKGTPDKIVLADTLTANGLTFKDVSITSVKKQSVQYDEYGYYTVTDSTDVDIPSISDPTVDTGCASFDLTLEKLEAYQQYVITYEYRLDSLPGDINVNAKNTATASSGNKNTGTHETVSSESSANTKISRKTIDKSGKFEDGVINWTITVNDSKTNIAGQTLTDTMFEEVTADDITVTRQDGSAVEASEYTIEVDKAGKVTGIIFNAANDNTNTNSYVVTYSTPVTQTTNQATVKNEASLNGQSASGSVTVPAGGGLNKSLAKVTTPDDSGNFTMDWTLTITVPQGGIPAGSELLDRAMDSNWGSDDSVHWINYQQLAALSKTLESTKLSGAEVYVYNSSSYSWVAFSNVADATAVYTQFKIKFNNDISYVDGGANEYTISYSTTGNTSKVEDSHTYLNNATLGGLRAEDTYTYQNKVVKLNGKGQASDQTISAADANSFDGILYWYVKVVVDKENYTSMEVLDTLPDGVELQQIGIGTSVSAANSNLASPAASFDAGTISVKGQDVQVTVTNSRYLGANTTFYLCYQCKVSDGTTVVSGTSFKNEVSVTTNGETSYGFDTREEIIRFTENTSDKDYVSKSGSWDNDSRTMKYSVVLNANGADLNPNSDTISLQDTLSYFYNKTHAPISAYLIQSSVQLYVLNSDGSKTPYNGDWTWTYSQVDNRGGYDSGNVYHNIDLTIPDGQAFVLEYNYEISMEDASTTTERSFSLRNSMTMTLDDDTQHNDTTGESEKLKWEVSSSSASISSGYRFTKVDSANNRIVLPGAVFTLYQYGDETDSEVTYNGKPVTYTTNDSGTFTITQPSAGTEGFHFQYNTVYYLMETSAPEGYLIGDAEKYYFYFSSENSEIVLGEVPTGAVDLTGSSAVAIVGNKKNTTSITISKEWFAADGTAETKNDGAVTVKLYRKLGDKVSDDGSTEESGSDEVSLSFKLGEYSEYTSVYTNEISCKKGSTISFVVSINWSGTAPTFYIADSQNSRVALEAIESSADTASTISVYTYRYSIVLTENATITGCFGTAIGNVTVGIIEIQEPVVDTPEDDATENPSEENTGVLVGEYTIQATDNWTLTLDSLSKTNEDGYLYLYYVEEVPVTNYTSSYENNRGINQGTITIQNTHDQQISYELPETGGNGAELYTVGALLALAGGAALLRKKRRA